MTTPAPFTTLEWRIIGRDDSGYFDGFVPVFGQRDAIQFKYYPSEDYLIESISDHWPVQRLLWFTHGFYRVTLRGTDILITDLRMGLEGNYVFNFKVAENSETEAIPTTSIQM